MRIICPDCDAQYEVPDDMIPAEGRDVQCSNCGRTWFFDASGVPAPPPGEPLATAASDEAATADVDPEAEDPEADAGATILPVPRRELDPKVAEILRTEAEREAAARAQEADRQPLEFQPELGLTRGSDPARGAGHSADNGDEASDAPLPFVPASEPRPVPATSAAPSRRDRFPDIEAFRPALDPDRKRYAVGDTRSRRGFWGGLTLALLLFAACLAAYQFAAEIAQAVPEVDPWLSDYVTWVDESRAGLDESLSMFMDWLDAQLAAVTG